MYLIKKRIGFLLVATFLVCFSKAWAQKFKVPLEIKQTKVTLNISHHGGLPISTVQGNPVGSNGNAPAFQHQDDLKQTSEPPTNGNFAGATILAGGWRTKLEISEATNITGSINAGRENDNIGPTILTLPQSSVGNVKMRWAAIGTPLVSRPVSFLLGGKITPPKINEFGLPLDVDPETYWQPMPHKRYEALSASVVSGGSGYAVDDTVTVSGANDGAAAKFRVAKVESGVVKRVELVGGGSYLGPITESRTVTAVKNDGAATTASGLVLQVKAGFTKFYWSPHANAAFATQPGIIEVTWIRIAPVTTKDERATYYSLSSSHFALLEKSYVVSGAAVKPYKTIFWTEKQFKGPLVQVPNAQVNAVNIIYNSNFPRRVTAEFSDDWVTDKVEDITQVLQEDRTLWFEYGSLHAYNAEGRVFVEYLGAAKENGIDRVHLGFEIVDVRKEANPIDLNVDLGDAITPDGKENPKLYPQPVLKTTMDKPHLHDFTGMDGVRRLYATRETENLNDVLVYWMEKGEQDIRWPRGYSRYKLQWPVEASKYSHYARASESRADAMRSSVQLPPENNPILDYQSNEEQNLAAITADQKFYVHLETPIKEHRALIRFMGEGRIWFERVYSFLDTWAEDLEGILSDSISIYEISTSNGTVTVKTGASSSSTVEHGFSNGDDFTISGASPSVYNGTHTVVSTTNTQFTFKMDGSPSLGTTGIVTKKPIPKKYSGILGIDWFMGDNKPAASERPAHFSAVATVGRRIVSPTENNDHGAVSDEDYWAGHIHTARGTSYNPNAYIDPMEKGFEEANQGAIIPVNAIPGKNKLEVWWFRKSERDGFKPVYWPSVVATYTIQWPHEVTNYKAESTRNAIILASNDGSGPINSLQARGNIYYENDLDNPGYNPNEEHALMIAGQAYALRDDLNIHRVNNNYSSSPYVLLEFADEDGRPDMRAFQVLREQPEMGITFNYAVEAGTILQAPMPLPLLPKPTIRAGNKSIDLNKEDYKFNVTLDNSNVNADTMKYNVPQHSYRAGEIIQLLGFKPIEYNGSFYVTSTETGSITGYYIADEPLVVASVDSQKQDAGIKGVFLQTRPTIKWAGTYETKTQNYGNSFPLIIAESGDVTINGKLVTNIGFSKDKIEFKYPHEVDGTIFQLSGEISFSAGQTGGKGITFSGVIQPRPQDGLVIYTGTMKENTSPNNIDIIPDRWKNMKVAVLGVNPRQAVVNNSKGHAIANGITVTVDALPNAFISKDVITFEGGGILTLTVDANVGATSVSGNLTVAALADNEVGRCRKNLLTIKDVYNADAPDEVGVKLKGPGDVGNDSRLYRIKNKPTSTLTKTGVVWSSIPSTTPGSKNHFTFKDRKQNVWVYRGADQSVDKKESFSMSFYYKTQKGFSFPGASATITEGDVVPYLRRDPKSDPMGGKSGSGGVNTVSSHGIRYFPKWPEDVPIMSIAQTLTKPIYGLPAVRGQTSMEILFQESVNKNAAEPSVILHDPTREKEYRLAKEKGEVLHKIPGSVKTEIYQGKTYFPNLPPHLVKRFFYDANRGEKGALVFKGEFVDEVVGEDYLLLNVAGSGDLAALKSLCPDSDITNEGKWKKAIDGLKTELELFVHNDAKPGTYLAPDYDKDGTADAGFRTDVGIQNIAEVTDGDQAVDSYALTASGPGIGYVTLLTGNGRAFTPAGEPVSLHVIKVVPELHPGEVKVIAAENPLNEKLTMQQTLDLAGKPDNFEFEWKIAPPNDGLKPSVYETQPYLLLADGKWKHVAFPVASDESKLQSDAHFGARAVNEVTTQVIVVSELPYDSVKKKGKDANQLQFDANTTTANRLALGAKVTARLKNGAEVDGTVREVDTAKGFSVEFSSRPDPSNVDSVFEQILESKPQSIVYRTFDRPKDTDYKELWLSMNLDDNLGAEVYIDGTQVVRANMDSGNTEATSTPVIIQDALRKSWRVPAGPVLVGAESGDVKTHRVMVKLYSSALPGAPLDFNLRLHGITVQDQTSVAGSQWKALEPKRYSDGVRAVIGGEADVQALSDNYLTMRYKAKDSTNYPAESKQYSLWTEPQLAEGWIKRVLAGINPFHQRVKNLFNNRVDTGVSMLTQAGPRWEGDVALNMDNINDFGLIEIYETVLNRGKMLSIDAGINYGPANDALLLAAGYINDLYMFLGNEARADAANPTIGIGTTDGELGSIATALFAFKGQVPSLLEEELGLLRGRDDFLQPGARTAPAYNRFYWNYTRGIDAGEVIYALNYNITEDEDQGFDGLVNAEDAQKMYPQGHGDAYGHYLTALKGYYQLLVDEDFTWAPRTEAVLVLGKPVQVDYLDERKFAAAAAAVARTGNQVAELTWRRDYKSQEDAGWEHFSSTRYNSSEGTTRRWGVDQWASRTGSGSYLNWVTGNAMLPDEDPNPEHEGIQKIDRQTVPELLELVTIGEDLQVTMDNAEGGLNPLGLDENSIAMDIDPHFLEAGSGTFTFTHFDQVYTRALVAMNNATAAFDDAKGVTEMMRSEENSLNDFQAEVDGEELAYKHALIELYGTPYPDDIGPGKTYPQGYDGPDVYHYAYVEILRKNLTDAILATNDKTKPYEFKIDIQGWDGGKTYTQIWKEYDSDKNNLKEIIQSGDAEYSDPTPQSITFHINKTDGFLQKPEHFVGKRTSPGELQSAISGIFLAQNALREALNNHWGGLKGQLDREIELFEEKVKTYNEVRELNGVLLGLQTTLDALKQGWEIYDAAEDAVEESLDGVTTGILAAIPSNFIAGLAAGGDMASAAKAGILGSHTTVKMVKKYAGLYKLISVNIMETVNRETQRWLPYDQIAPLEWKQEVRDSLYTLDMSSWNVQMSLFDIASKIQELDEAERAYRALLASGDRIQAEREIFRQRSSAIVQGFRTRDAGFRIFRNEKLERYKTLYDLAARYTYLAAKAYDYETGLLHTGAGKDFLDRIVAARALGVMADGEPHFAGSDTGDPGLSSVLAEMKGDYEVLRGRLGFNNPDTQGTTLSLRLENHRILPGNAGEQNWKDVLHGARRDNLLDDADVTRHCMQIDTGNGLPVPGLILEFRTTIEDGYNLLGHPLAGGDSHFSPSNYATKIHGVGIGFENYVGMDVISTNGGSVDGAGGASPTGPNAPWLDSQSLSSTPHVYLIPVGQDIMRSPPLGDGSVLRSWNVKDVTIPLPFNIGASEFSARSIWQTKDILSEELFSIRKHQAFRAVLWEAADGGTFSDTAPIYAPSKIVNNRLVGRSVWNTKWKLIIPGKTLLNDPEEGLDRFINSVSDIKLHFETYSYSGN
ncbi:hypothetical protein OAF43_00380 [bacterium]|nr:hypothetical protein [bacterium]